MRMTRSMLAAVLFTITGCSGTQDPCASDPKSCSGACAGQCAPDATGLEAFMVLLWSGPPGATMSAYPSTVPEAETGHLDAPPSVTCSPPCACGPSTGSCGEPGTLDALRRRRREGDRRARSPPPPRSTSPRRCGHRRARRPPSIWRRAGAPGRPCDGNRRRGSRGGAWRSSQDLARGRRAPPWSRGALRVGGGDQWMVRGKGGVQSTTVLATMAEARNW